MDRLTQLREYMEKERLDAFYIAKPANVRCISGFTGEDSFLFITKANQYFITDARYTEQASYECPDYELVNWRINFGYSMGKAVAYCADKDGVKTIGFEQDHLTFEKWNSMQAELSAEMVPTLNVIEGFRAIKTPEEIKNLTVACDIASRAFEKIIKDIRPGVTEKEIASRLAHYMVMEGADTKPYGGIVISGAKSSLLHGIPDSKPIEYGDFVLMDYGCQYKGYLSDMTRTVVVGKANDKQKEIYNTVLKAQTTAIDAIKAGMKCSEVDGVARKIITDAGYGENFGHSLGHSVGIEIHENPSFSPKSNAVVQNGNVITVEPGIYIDGFGGVRIEDLIVVQNGKAVNLTSSPKELIEI